MKLVDWLEKLGGVRPLRADTPARAVVLGLWWTALLLLTLLFSGRYSKFVYVDF